MVYGEVEIPIDFITFIFDPMITISITLFNYVVFFLLRKLFKIVFEKQKKLKISWLKFSFFESFSEVII